MAPSRKRVLLSVMLCVAAAASVRCFVEELDDSFLEWREADDVWLIKFYAPWCSFCKELEPLWRQVGSELRSLGSSVNVGRSDGTAHTGLAKEFRVRGYPAILMWKKEVKYQYSGARTKDAILDFAMRLSGPPVRALSSLQLFQHAMSRHHVMFVYVGAASPLKGNYSAAAQELIVHSYFFSVTRDVLPKTISIWPLPAVVLFKDGRHFTYDEESDGELRSWMNRERFPNYQKVDSYTLYAMGESGKLVLLALVEERAALSAESLRYKSLVERVAEDYREIYSRDVQFGFMEGSDYVSGLVMGEVLLPSLIALNLSTDSYFLPPSVVDTERHLLDFLDQVLDGRLQCRGGNGVTQRVRRLAYDAKLTLTTIFGQAPLLGCFLLGFPLLLVGVFCFLCCKARPTFDGEEDEDEDDGALRRRRKMIHKKSD